MRDANDRRIDGSGFLSGESNDDGFREIGDAVSIVRFAVSGGALSRLEDADVSDSGEADLTGAIIGRDHLQQSL